MNEENERVGINQELSDAIARLSEQVVELQKGSQADTANLRALNLAVMALVKLTPGAPTTIKALANALLKDASTNPENQSVREFFERELNLPL